MFMQLHIWKVYLWANWISGSDKLDFKVYSYNDLGLMIMYLHNYFMIQVQWVLFPPTNLNLHKQAHSSK